jgi:glycosyltransferase involved in cell wall biosynthesis
MSAASLIISVYDKVRELELIFYALTVQSFKDFEVIIAEDGQNQKIKDLISVWNQKNLFPIVHLTQEDKGFRKNKILNEAIRNVSTGYLIFIDGDCLPHSDFMKAHFNNTENNTVLCGRRVNLTKTLSEKINCTNILNRKYQKINFADVIYSALNKDKKDFNFNIEEGFILKNKTVRNALTNRDEHILGCNFSLHKILLERINGFDENYQGPGLGEDSDIEFRLRLLNVKFKSVRNLAVQFHFYHGKTLENPVNMEYFIQVKNSKKYFCKNGLVKV